MVYLQARLNTALILYARGRDDKLELPVEALCETIVNAIASDESSIIMSNG